MTRQLPLLTMFYPRTGETPLRLFSFLSPFFLPTPLAWEAGVKTRFNTQRELATPRSTSEFSLAVSD